MSGSWPSSHEQIRERWWPRCAQHCGAIRNQSSSPDEDVQSFVDAIAFNWLIAGTDAHAKNYSLLLGKGAGVRLAPIYDLASILPYRTVDLRRVKLAMKIGGEYRLRNIGLRHWQRLATELRLDQAAIIDRIRVMASALPDYATDIQKQIEGEGLSHTTITRLSERLKRERRPAKNFYNEHSGPSPGQPQRTSHCYRSIKVRRKSAASTVPKTVPKLPKKALTEPHGTAPSSSAKSL